MEFGKYEATGNDFIIIDGMRGAPELSGSEVRALCHRQTGVGADGIIIMAPSIEGDVMMRVLNADGTEAQMCGNGIRALFEFATDRGVACGDTLKVETMAGLRVVRARAGDSGRLFTVEMGEASHRFGDIPMHGPPQQEAIGVPIAVGNEVLEATCVSMGNPHCVIFTEDVESFPVASVGTLVENHEIFPERTNVEFVKVIDPRRLAARVWERGVGETMACGTGACASVVAAILNGLIEGGAVVELPGGELEIEVEKDGVRLTGPARHVFDGTVEMDV